MRRTAVGLWLAIAAASPLFAQERAPRPIEPEDFYRVSRVGSTAISPDGRHLLFTVQTVRRTQNDRLTEIWWADLETGRNQRLTTPGINSTNPNWTPDGRRIYFNSARGDERGTFFLNFLEPGGEAYTLPGLTGSPNFAPDGSWILITRSVPMAGQETAEGEGARGERSPPAGRQPWPTGTPGLTGPTATASRGRTEAERNRDVYVITHNSYKRDGSLNFVPPPQEQRDDVQRYTQFFRIPADGLPEGQEPVQLTFDPVDKSFQGFSSDGRWILYTVNLTRAEREAAERDGEPRDEDDDDADDDDEREMPEWGVFRVPSGGGEAQEITRVQASNIRSVAMSPDSRRIAFVVTDRPRTDPYISVVDLSGRAVATLAKDDWKYTIGSPVWSADGRRVLWISGIGGQDQVVSAPATGGPVTRVTDGRHILSSVSFDARMRRMAYVKTTAERPWEAFVADIDGSGERQVSTINDEWVRQVKIGRVERFTYQGVPHNREWLDQLPERGVEYMLANNAPDGEEFEIEAWLIYPPDYEPGRRYPMVVTIHGGPHSRYSEIWFQEFQMLASQGMLVLYTNPRGSSHYGMEFQFSTLNAWGIDDTKDVLQAVDIVVERGIADPERLGITGGSYGGFMTNWITAHDQRFRAAITARSISNWLSFYGVSDASGLVEREFGGMPWPYESREEGSYRLAMMLSPIVWADRVTTPTLIIHSINDYRTPLPEGEQWYRALRKHDVPVKMVLFPDSSHGLSRGGEPWLLVRRLREYRDWFREHLLEDPPVVADGY